MYKIIVFSLLVLSLTSCFGDSKEVIDAKKDMGIIEKTQEDIKEDIKEEDLVEDVLDNTSDDPRISIKQISGEKMLKLDELKYENFKNGHELISGITTEDVDKIRVEFSNENSEYPNDSYILAKFNSGKGEKFEYNANSKYKVLDFGLNEYIITAYHGDKKSVIELKVLVSLEDDEFLEDKSDKIILNEKDELTNVSDLVGDENDLVFTELPEGGDFGNVVKLGEKSFTYSDIKGLEVKKEIFKNVDCTINEETEVYFLTEFLRDRQNSYYYWNTCRDIVKGKGISFYLIRLEGSKYFYEKHYIDTKNGFYGVYEIESGEGVDKYNISDKNKELKELNETFKQIEVVDNLFKNIIK